MTAKKLHISYACLINAAADAVEGVGMNSQNLFPLLTDEGIESFLRDSETGYEEQAIRIYRTYRAYGEIPLVAAISTIQDLIPLISE